LLPLPTLFPAPESPSHCPRYASHLH
jgi:hypothetical protein